MGKMTVIDSTASGDGQKTPGKIFYVPKSIPMYQATHPKKRPSFWLLKIFQFALAVLSLLLLILGNFTSGCSTEDLLIGGCLGAAIMYQAVLISVPRIYSKTTGQLISHNIMNVFLVFLASFMVQSTWPSMEDALAILHPINSAKYTETQTNYLLTIGSAMAAFLNGLICLIESVMMIVKPMKTEIR